MKPAASVPPVEWVRLPTEAQLREIVTELYACHYILRSYQIRSEDLYVTVAFVPNMVPPGHHVCVLVRRGQLEAAFTLQRVPHEWQEQIGASWTRFIERELPSLSESELDRMVSSSQVRGHAVDMARVLALKGLLVHLDPRVN